MSISFHLLFCNGPLKKFYTTFLLIRRQIATSNEKIIEQCYKTLNIPPNSKQDVVRRSFLEMAKQYHPDSGTPDANIEKFVEIENAFRTLSKHNTGKCSQEDMNNIVHDIRHTAPQHRQYLSYDGVGHGTPAQRQKQWTAARAQKAAENVLEHRMEKSLASEKTLMKKGQYFKTHAIKTKYGFDRLVEDLIQESMSKGEFENLSGKGKPLKEQNRNPYVDFTTHKLNEVLINNGFTPEWITLNKDIDQEIEALKKEIANDRRTLGPAPLTPDENEKWLKICEANRELAQSINAKINTFNLLVPLLDRQRLHVNFDKMAADILKDGVHFDSKSESLAPTAAAPERPAGTGTRDGDLLSDVFSMVLDLFKKNKGKIT